MFHVLDVWFQNVFFLHVLCSSLLQENTQLTVPILDALSSLNLSTSLLTEVKHSHTDAYYTFVLCQ